MWYINKELPAQYLGGEHSSMWAAIAKNHQERVVYQYPSVVLSSNENETIGTKPLAHFKSQFITLSKTIKCYIPNLSC